MLSDGALLGTDTADVIVGSWLDDLISGKSGDDQIIAREGNDLIIGGEGDDLLDGGQGYDVAIMSFLASQYDYLEDTINSPEGIDTLVDIEKIGFGYNLDNPIYEVEVSLSDLTDPDGAGPDKSPASQLLDEISDLYIAYFDHAPDVAGLSYWFAEIYSGSLSLFDTAKSFTDQPEYAENYPAGSSNRDFVKSIYENLFDRLPDGPGWDYWEGELNSGMPRDTFILTVINGAYAPTGGASDRGLLINKHDVSMYYAEQSSLHPEEGFDENITAVLNRVGTDPSTVASAIDVIDYAMENPITLAGIVQDAQLWESFWMN